MLTWPPLGVQLGPIDPPAPKKNTVGGAFVLQGHYPECPIELRTTVIYSHNNALYQSDYVESTPDIVPGD